MRKRRGRGEGAIYKLKHRNLWATIVTIGYDRAGRRKRRYVYGETKKEVQDKLLKLQNDVSKGTLVNIDKISVGEFLCRWLEDSVKNSVRPSTFARYELVIRKHVIPYIGDIQLKHLSVLHMQSFYSQLERENCPSRTRQMTHVILKRALSQAVQWGQILRNPCEFLAKPKVPKRAIRYWDRHEIELFLKTAKGNRLYALFVLAVTTGLRQGEIFALKWSDLNFENKTLSVTRSTYELKGKIFVGEPKTQKSRRCIDLPQFAVGALEEHYTRMASENHHHDWIFCDTTGKILRRSNFRKRCFIKLIKQSGLKPISFHDLRHSAATLLLTQGVHPKVVQERLGHSQISVTLDTYSHVLPTLQKEAAQKIDDVFMAQAPKRNQKNHPKK